MANTKFEREVPDLIRRLTRDLPNISVESAAAVFGNAGHESNGFESLQEIAPTVKGSLGGWGWFQWTGPRRKAFDAFAKRKGLDPAGVEANYGFLVYELTGTEAGAVAAVRKATSLDAKVRAFEKAYERAGVKHYPSRIAWAKRALAAYQAAGRDPKPLAKDKATLTGSAIAGISAVGGAAKTIADAVSGPAAPTPAAGEAAILVASDPHAAPAAVDRAVDTLRQTQDAVDQIQSGSHLSAYIGIAIGVLVIVGIGVMLYGRWNAAGRPLPWGAR